MTYPNLFLLASPRSGSTQLARWLDTHADISLSAVKEPNFFSAQDFPEDFVRISHLNDVDPGLKPKRRAQFAVYREASHYKALFAGLTSRWLLDASTSYLTSSHAVSRIIATIPNARFILLTRNPFERAVSHYRLALRTGRTRASLQEALDEELSDTPPPPGGRYLIRPSQTTRPIRHIRQLIPAHQRIHLTYEDLYADPHSAMKEVARFLEIDNCFDLMRSARNGAATPRMAALNAWINRVGLKTFIRRHTPLALRPIARKLWFNEGAEIPIPADQLKALKHALEER